MMPRRLLVQQLKQFLRQLLAQRVVECAAEFALQPGVERLVV